MTKQRGEKDKGKTAVELKENELEKVTAGSGSSSAPSVSEITVTKRMDKASPKLFTDS
jgi:type VI protein secretion system component Hcp